MVYRLKMEDAGIVVGKAGQRCALTALQGGMPRRSAVGARLPATGCAAVVKFQHFADFYERCALGRGQSALLQR